MKHRSYRQPLIDLHAPLEADPPLVPVIRERPWAGHDSFCNCMHCLDLQAKFALYLAAKKAYIGYR